MSCFALFNYINTVGIHFVNWYYELAGKNYFKQKKFIGKPVIKGTRISVEFILERLADGWSEEKVFESYPHLKKEDIHAVFACLND